MCIWLFVCVSLYEEIKKECIKEKERENVRYVEIVLDKVTDVQKHGFGGKVKYEL